MFPLWPSAVLKGGVASLVRVVIVLVVSATENPLPEAIPVCGLVTPPVVTL